MELLPVFLRFKRTEKPIPNRLHRAFAIFLLAAIAVTAIRYYHKAEKPSRLGELTRTAFLRWRPQILALDTQTNIYQEFQYPNPPIMALILYPFVSLPPLVGAMTWFFMKVFMAYVMIRWTLNAIAKPNPPPDWARGLAILLSMHAILGDLSHGNVNIFIGFLAFAVMALFMARRDFASGLVLALAIACKVTPGLFIPYFVWKRAWRALAGTAVGLVLWLFVVPGAILGWQTNQTLLVSWYDGMVKPFVVEGKVTSEHANQSIPGVVFRLLTAEPSFLEYDEDDRPVAADFHNVMSLTPDQARWIVKGAMALFAGAVVLWFRWRTDRPSDGRGGPFLLAEFGVILLGMLLFSERTWKHHATTLIVPLAVLTWAASSPVMSQRFRTCMLALIGVVGLLMIVPSLLAEESQDLAMVYGTHTAAFLLMTVGLFVILANRADQSRHLKPDTSRL